MMLISYFSLFLTCLLILKMQELEQRVMEAEQRAEDAEKQVRGHLTWLWYKPSRNLLSTSYNSLYREHFHYYITVLQTLIYGGEWSLSLSYEQVPKEVQYLVKTSTLYLPLFKAFTCSSMISPLDYGKGRGCFTSG